MVPDNSPIIRARDVMHKGILAIDGMATAKEAAAQMRSEKTRCLLVKKRHIDDAWGIVVVQDLIKGVIIAGRSAAEVNVYEIMTKPVITVPADMDIRYVARLLYRAGIRRAPVEDGGDIVGMISLSSLILENEFF
ncbi:MAG: CBS domain-containing protein [Proteobacteria bacterium]|nr:CBS domain-containing protein [Pseudomonadota bacterium]MBU1140269.1 CBS domain-containing protein [Pseudomonadota bacterium]MBU1234374.1 CBS domain-containing protein [Pseudomonadota bacterium]MBU1419523.1 CBS domain-containing protein [Pseudomonadota bacterium]MBU1453914.1 CBS domain-containing protein [Pseudomonadota bacterium]